jgi:deoxyribonuclease V
VSVEYLRLHSWNVSTKEAREIQLRLRARLNPVWDGRTIRTVAGADVGFPDKNTVCASVVVLSFPELEILESSISMQDSTFPYVPGLLTFREAPGLLSALDGIRTPPDVLLCDGQGIAHQRRMGLAAHIGLLLDRPVIGCAKSVLCGTFDQPAAHRGAMSFMLDKGEIIGAALRTRDGVKPVYVSIGNRIDLGTAVDIVLKCSPRYRIPEPLRMAHKLSSSGSL